MRPMLGDKYCIFGPGQIRRHKDNVHVENYYSCLYSITSLYYCFPAIGDRENIEMNQ